MSVEIAVIYGTKGGALDDAVVRVPWKERLLLPRGDQNTHGVVAMSIIDLNNPNKRNRHQQVISLDIYHLIWTDADCHLGGHTEDFLFCSLMESWKNPVWRFP